MGVASSAFTSKKKVQKKLHLPLGSTYALAGMLANPPA